MAKKKKCECNCPECMPAWLAAFGDLMSLLLCFFVLLLSMSTMDAKKIKEAIGSLSGALSVLEGGTQSEVSRERVQQATPIEKNVETTDAVNRISSTVVEHNEMTKMASGPTVTMEEGEEGFMLRLPSSLLFKPGSAKIENEEAILFLRRIALIIEKLPPDLDLNVIGHTDIAPPAENSMFKDNWELSTARAVSVVKELITNDVNPKRLIASGVSSHRPIATNQTEEGREKNRRVEIYFFAKKKDLEQKAQQATKSVLDMKN